MEHLSPMDNAPDNTSEVRRYIKERLSFVGSVEKTAREAREKGVSDEEAERKLQRLAWWREFKKTANKMIAVGEVGQEEMIEAEAAAMVEVEFAAGHDKLTGLANRNEVQERARDIFDEAKKKNLPVVLFFFDIDNLKITNDRLGHAKGDELILRVSEIIKKYRMPGDIAGRIGGDEFLLITADTTIKEAEMIRQAMEKDLRDILGQIEVLILPEPPNISVGMAQWDKSETLEKLQKRADLEMYKDKRKKKNE